MKITHNIIKNIKEHTHNIMKYAHHIFKGSQDKMTLELKMCNITNVTQNRTIHMYHIKTSTNSIMMLTHNTMYLLHYIITMKSHIIKPTHYIMSFMHH